MGPTTLVARGAAGVGVPVEAAHLPCVLAEEAHGVLRRRDSDHTQSKSASKVGKQKIDAGSGDSEVKDDEVATGDGDEASGGGNGDGR